MPRARTSAWHVSSWGAEGLRCGPARPAFLAFALVAGLVLTSPAAYALEVTGPLVVVISSEPNEPFVRRLAAELSLFGYRVEVAPSGASGESLAVLLERSGGAALISVDQRQRTAEIVVANEAGSGPARRDRERLDPRRRADINAAVLAERFRARLTQLGIVSAGPMSPPEVPPKPVLESPRPQPAEPEKRLWLMAAVGGTSGGLGVMPDLSVEVRTFPARWLSTSAFVKFSPFPAQISAAEGSAEVTMMAGGVLIELFPVRRRFELKLGAGALLINANMSGSAAAPWGGREDAVLVPAGLLRGGVVFPLSVRSAVELDAFLGLSAPRVAVRFAGRSVKQFGQPFIGLALGAAVGVF